MKNLLVAMAALLSFGLAANAAMVTISNIHICCGGCVKAVSQAEASVPGITVVTDENAGTVILGAADTATLQKGADALVAAGFFGTSSDPAVKINTDTGAKNQQVQAITVEHLHLCCGKCVSTVKEALKGVPGVTGNTVKKGAKSFEVTGNFNDQDVFAALQKAGLTGHEQ